MLLFQCIASYNANLYELVACLFVAYQTSQIFTVSTKNATEYLVNEQVDEGNFSLSFSGVYQVFHVILQVNFHFIPHI